MSEAVNEVKLQNGNIALLACGYDVHLKSYREISLAFTYGQEALEMGKAITKILQAERSVTLINKDCKAQNILKKITDLASKSSPSDTLFFYYSGHSNMEALEVPISYRSPARNQLGPLLKRELFETMGAFRGRKIAILNCCHSDFEQIPDNTLLVSACSIDTMSWGDSLVYKLIHDLAGSELAARPLNELVNRLLRNYHNFPLKPLKGRNLQEEERVNEYTMYATEKRLGQAILKNYQRAIVRSTLVENGVPLLVDPKCNFIPTI